MNNQLELFSISNATDGVDLFEAPTGFYAISKEKATTPNVCNSCDAKLLCQENQDDWCLKNRCISGEIIAFKDRKIYKRKDGNPVIFKKTETNKDYS